MPAVGRRTVVGRRTEVGTTGVGVSSVRCPATFLAYSMPPIDSAKNVRQANSQVIIHERSLKIQPM